MFEERSFPARNEFLLVLAAIGVACLGIFFTSLHNDFVSLDDNILIYNNPLVKTPFDASSLKQIFTSYDPELYIPFTFLTYKLEHLLFGLNPFVFHLTNLALHVLTAGLVYLFAYCLTRHMWLSFFVALFFAIHPVNVEAVAWAAARKDLLASFFFFLSILLYLRYQEARKRQWYLLSIAVFACALLAKVSVLLLPFVLLIIDWRDKRTIGKNAVIEKMPYLLLTVIFGLVAALGKTTVLANSTVWEKFLMSMKSILFYLQVFVFPLKLAPIYPYNGTITLVSPDFFIPLIIVAALLIAILVSLRWTREVVFGFGLFFLPLIPSFINFSKGGSLYIASDRYVYVSFIGLLYLIGLAVRRFVDSEERYHAQKQKRMSVLVILAAIGIAFAVKSHAQSLTWRDSEALYVNVLRHYPDSFHAMHNLASHLFKYSDRIDEAQELFEKALVLKPDNASIVNNIGILYRHKGNEQEAMKYYQRAIELKPDFVEPYYGIAILHMQTGRIDQAVTWYKKALEVEPDHVKSHINLAAMYSSTGDMALAMEEYAKALEIDPTVPEPHFNLGILLEKQGRLEEAVRSYEMAIRYNPSYLQAYNNLGALYLDQKEYERAASYFQQALDIDPSFAPARQNLDAIRSFLQ